MEPTFTEEQESLARKGLEYAETITRLAMEMELEPGFVLCIFGAFAKKLIGNDLNNEAAVQWAVSSFMSGMGFDVNEIGRIPPPARH